MSQGIYIFANDFVYHQVVALLNSIEVNAGEAFPVCIIPYDHKLDKIKQEVAARENVTLSALFITPNNSMSLKKRWG